MSKIIAQDQTLELKVFCRAISQTGINVLHYKVMGTTGNSLTDVTLANQLSQLAAPVYKAWLPTAFSYSGCRLQIIQPAPAAVYVTSTASSGFGTVVGDPLPPQSSVLVSKRSNLAGRINRGRVYLPFWSETHCDAQGVITAAGQTLAANWATQFMATITVTVGGDSVTIAPVVYNRKTGGSVFIARTVIPAQFATQRRRSQINRGDLTGP